MAEELGAGGVCGGSWWLNSPRSLCSSGGLSPCSSAVLLDDGKASSRSFLDQDLLSHGDGAATSMEDSGMKSEIGFSAPTIYADSTAKSYLGQQQTSSAFPGSFESAGSQLSSSSYTFASSLLQNLFDGDSSYMVNQDDYFGNLVMINSAELPEYPSQLVDFPAMLMPSDHHQVLPESTKASNHNKFISQNHGEGTPPPRKNSGANPPPKRQRIETPSPLPTFKVRKEKLGDRVTALQQLVSPFGKTDTASVLHEAIEYIKFLHAQVNLLSAPYFKSETSSEPHQQTVHEVRSQGLRTRGLCLMPVSISYPMATEATNGLWTPTFERIFR